MPSLVIERAHGDGHEARVSKTSVAGSWGAVAGNLAFLCRSVWDCSCRDRGHHISYDLVRRYATLGRPKSCSAPRASISAHDLERRLSYFGFDLDTEFERSKA